MVEKMSKDKYRALKLYELRKKSPGVAVLLSLLFTGLGSMYAGKVGKGFLILIIQIFMWIFLLGWIAWIIAPIIAYQDVKKYNMGLEIELKLDKD